MSEDKCLELNVYIDDEFIGTMATRLSSIKNITCPKEKRPIVQLEGNDGHFETDLAGYDAFKKAMMYNL